jgi:hypothetical protein
MVVVMVVIVIADIVAEGMKGATVFIMVVVGKIVTEATEVLTTIARRQPQ